MPILPSDIMPVLLPFAQVFSDRTWPWVQVLIVGAILAPGQRTVTAILRVMGLSDERQFQNYHRVLNRVKWSGLRVSRILLGLLVVALVAVGAPLVIAADETLERRSGKKIKQKGAFRDAVRSSKTHTVTSFGLRWVSMMLLVPVPWSRRVWALPFLTVLAPSEKTNRANGKRHKTSIDWIGQMMSVVRRWFPTRPIVLVVDGGLSAIKLGLRCARLAGSVTYISRLRLDAVLHDPPPAPIAGKRGPKPKKGKRQASLKARVTDPETEWKAATVRWYGGVERAVELASGTALWYTPGEDPLPLRWVLVRDPLGTFAPQAFFATDQAAMPVQVVEWFVLRWNEEVTFEEARAHLGLETQRQWSEVAIERTTPVLLGLFSLVTLAAQQLSAGGHLPVRRAAWYTKPEATFADALALVRQHLWSSLKFPNSAEQSGVVPIPRAMLHGLIDTLCYAA
jgi:DDE superfamily endonuclease